MTQREEMRLLGAEWEAVGMERAKDYLPGELPWNDRFLGMEEHHHLEWIDEDEFLFFVLEERSVTRYRFRRAGAVR